MSARGGEVVEPGRRPPWLALACAFGLALRAYHYARNPSIWHDEAALVLNVLHLSWVGMFWGNPEVDGANYNS